MIDINFETLEEEISKKAREYEEKMNLKPGSLRFAGLTLYFTDDEIIVQDKTMEPGFDPDEGGT